MTNDIKEYHPNGCIKHKIRYYDNGCKYVEEFYDKKGKSHRENNLPDYQAWNENGRLNHKTYYRHGQNHNICNPADISFYEDGKIWWKYYHLKKNWPPYTKLDWMNKIKNI